MPAPMASPAPELVLNAEHYSRVLRDILPTTKEFLWIATADLKDVFVEGGPKSRPFRPLVAVFAELVGRGVAVRLLHASAPISTNMPPCAKATCSNAASAHASIRKSSSSMAPSPTSGPPISPEPDSEPKAITAGISRPACSSTIEHTSPASWMKSTPSGSAATAAHANDATSAPIPSTSVPNPKAAPRGWSAFIRQANDSSGRPASSHAELGLSAPGNAEPQLGECFQNSAKATLSRSRRAHRRSQAAPKKNPSFDVRPCHSPSP